LDRDRFRDIELAGQGWETVRLVSEDVHGLLLRAVTRIAALLALRAPARYRDIEIDRRALSSR
jgi:very-short-patch-repair endonuclease